MDTINAVIYFIGLGVVIGLALSVIGLVVLFLWCQLSQAAHMSWLMKKSYNRYPNNDSWKDEYVNSRFKFLKAFWFYGFTQFLPMHGSTVHGCCYQADYTKLIPSGFIVDFDEE